MDLKNFGVEELSSTEKKSISGGADYHWYSGSNPIIYAGYAVYNGGVAVYNWWYS